MKKVNTKELLEIMINLQNHTIEASLNNGTFNATHFLRFGGRKVYDCGIDSADISWNIDEFLRHYPQAFWKIEQIA